MKIKYKLLFIILFFSSIFTKAGIAEESLKIAYTQNGKPWAWQESEKNKGILIEIADEALSKRMGVNISHHFFPWKRAQKYVERGEMDALITNHTDDRKKYTEASRELVTNIKRSIFMKKGNPKIDEVSKIVNLSGLKKFTIGNYIGNNWAKKNLKGLDVYWTHTSQSALVMLSHGRFDLYIGNPVATKYKLKVLNIQNIIMLQNSLEEIKPSQFRLLIRKNSNYVDILKKFDVTIRKMKEEGVIDSIFNKYQ